MAMQSIVKGLLLVVALGPACASKKGADPPLQSPAAPAAPADPAAPATEASSPDAGLPMVPLSRKGVVVPSDVKLQAVPATAGPATADAPRTTATPTAN
jgi:hypothetical protein